MIANQNQYKYPPDGEIYDSDGLGLEKKTTYGDLNQVLEQETDVESQHEGRISEAKSSIKKAMTEMNGIGLQDPNHSQKIKDLESTLSHLVDEVYNLAQTRNEFKMKSVLHAQLLGQ